MRRTILCRSFLVLTNSSSFDAEAFIWILYFSTALQRPHDMVKFQVGFICAALKRFQVFGIFHQRLPNGLVDYLRN